MYRPFEIDKMIDASVCLVDTRENPRTDAYKRRIEAIGLPCERVALAYADYSCKTVDPAGNVLDMRTRFAIERKADLGELCFCFTHERARFQREFERAQADGCRIHLLIENANYEAVRHGKYNSRLSPQSLIASLLSWAARYNLQLHLCKAETSAYLIRQILRYELRNYLITEGEKTELWTN